MSKITTILTIAVLGIVAALGINYAQAANNAAGNAPRQNMLEQAVSDGIVDHATADKLQQYNQEQRQKQMQERKEERLGEAVREGTITADEAQQIRDWQNSRPEAMDKIGGFGKGHGRGMGPCAATQDQEPTETQES